MGKTTWVNLSRTSKKKKIDYSKKIISDIRWLLWIVTVGGILLTGMCIYKGYLGSLPWLSAMVGLPWTAHGVVCSFYLNMSKSDHREGGITFESAKANGFSTVTTTVTTTTDQQGSRESPSI